MSEQAAECPVQHTNTLIWWDNLLIIRCSFAAKLFLLLLQSCFFRCNSFLLCPLVHCALAFGRCRFDPPEHPSVSLLCVCRSYPIVSAVFLGAFFHCFYDSGQLYVYRINLVPIHVIKLQNDIGLSNWVLLFSLLFLLHYCVYGPQAQRVRCIRHTAIYEKCVYIVIPYCQTNTRRCCVYVCLELAAAKG